jgi:hypothetical protein
MLYSYVSVISLFLSSSSLFLYPATANKDRKRLDERTMMKENNKQTQNTTVVGIVVSG